MIGTPSAHEKTAQLGAIAPRCNATPVPAPVYTEFSTIPRGHFGTILCDPPTRFKTWSEKGKGRSAERHYPVMSWDELSALDVAALGLSDCVLFLWACWPTLPQSLDLIEAWGFRYINCAFDWTKADTSQMDMFRDDADVAIGNGYWTRANTEPCLLATRGEPKRLNADVRMAIVEPRREHSRKPDCVHTRIERLVSGPFVELFARHTRQGWHPRPGWSYWGNQIAASLCAAAGDEVPLTRDPAEADDDFAKSLEVAYDAIRQRIANGGSRGWAEERDYTGHSIDDLSIPPFLRRASP
jgi:N6-adenosine-specific RNA methylase IME4